MKTLYFECSMGAKADTIAAALLELTQNKEQIIEKINSLYNDKAGLILQTAESSGNRGSALFVKGNSEKDRERIKNRRHRVLKDMLDIIDNMHLDESVRENATGIANLIAQSVAAIKGISKEEAHLHSLASIDNVLIIVAVCLAMDEISPDHIACSPICLGMGYTHNVYGTVPVPTPPTAYLLTEIPTFTGRFEGELCTTTGAAILKWFVKKYENMPKMYVKKIGYGIGKEKFTVSNCLRAFLGEIISTGANGQFAELMCTIYDMTDESIDFAQKQLLDAGAYDVYTSSIRMNKNHNGVRMTCICDDGEADELAQMILKNTTAAYVGRTSYMAYKLQSDTKIQHTSLGDIRVNSYSGYGIERKMPMYDDVEEAALKNNISVNEAYNKVSEEIKDMQ